MAIVRGMLGALALIATLPAPLFAAPPVLEAYGELPAVEDMALSPDGANVAVAARIKGVRQLLILGADRKVRARAGLGEAKLRNIRWAGNDRVLATISSTQSLPPQFNVQRIETFGVIIVDATTGQFPMVFQGRSAIAPAVFGTYGVREIGGKWYGFFGGIELEKRTGTLAGYEFHGGHPSLFRVDLATNSATRIARPPTDGRARDWLVDANDEPGASLDISDDGKWQVMDGKGRPLASGVSPTGRIALVAFGKDGTSVIYRTADRSDGAYRYYEVPLSGGDAVEVLADDSIGRLYVEPANGRLLGYRKESGDGRPVLFDARQQATLTKVYRAFRGMETSVVEWTPTFSHVLARTTGKGDPGTYYLVDVAKLQAVAIGDVRPGIVADQVGDVSVFSYAASDGLAMDGILTLPPGRAANKLPVVILPHGGPTSHDEPTFDWWAQALASRGYAVLQPNFRGSTNRDAAFRLAGYGQWGRKMQTDLSDGLAALAAKGIVDPKRACIVGASYGGYAALAGVTLQNGLYRCAVSVAGVSDLAELRRTELNESLGSDMMRRSLRETLGNPSGFDAVSPRRNAARADAPVLLIHGRDDTIVPFHHSEAMEDALRAAGKPVELVVLREEDHWLSRAATRKQMLAATLEFVMKHNPPD